MTIGRPTFIHFSNITRAENQILCRRVIATGELNRDNIHFHSGYMAYSSSCEKLNDEHVTWILNNCTLNAMVLNSQGGSFSMAQRSL